MPQTERGAPSKMNATELTKQILDIHTSHFIPLQYPKEIKYIDEKGNVDRANINIKEPYIRMREIDDVYMADVLVFTPYGHKFIDDIYYSNQDGIGVGRTIEAALQDLLTKSKGSIPSICSMSIQG